MNQQANKGFKSAKNPSMGRLNNHFAIPCFYDSHLHLLGLGKYGSKQNLKFEPQSKNDLNTIETFEDLEQRISEINFEHTQDKSLAIGRLTHTQDKSLAIGRLTHTQDKSIAIGRLTHTQDKSIAIERLAHTQDKNMQRPTNFIPMMEGFGLKKKFATEISKTDAVFKKNNFNSLNFYWVLEDGHQLLVHGPILKDFNMTNQTYVFDDSNRSDFDSFIKSINKDPSYGDLKRNLLMAQSLLLKSGITHCRDLTSDLDQITALISLEKSNEYKIFTETYFSDFFGEKLEILIDKSLEAKSRLTDSNLIQHKGIKIFVDGTFSQLNVDTQCYHKHSDDHPKSKARTKNKYNVSDLKHFIKEASDHNLEIAFHTIGDGAVEKVIEAFDLLKDSFKTNLHLEHCELLNPKTLNYLSALEFGLRSKIKFHFQPSHFLLDRNHLAEIQKSDPSLYIFPWYELKKLGYDVFFGSDTPVTSPGLDYVKNIDFLKFFKTESESQTFWSMLSHPEYKKFPNTFTQFKNTDPSAVYINGTKYNL